MENEIKETQKKNNTPRLLILGAVLLVLGYFGINMWMHAQQHESTDNAQIDATIISVRSAVSGYVKEVRFSENQHVKKGDTLVIIDPVDYVARVMQAKAMIASAQAQAGVSRNAAEAATQNASASTLNSGALQANINAANARVTKAQKELDRLEKMFAQGGTTQKELDAAQSELQGATAQQQAATKQYQASLSQGGSIQSNARSQHEQISVSTALGQQRVAELQLAQSQLEHTVIVAPFDGIVSKKSVETGQLLQVSQPVCSAVESGNLWVNAIFKETQLRRLKTGAVVHISLDAYPDLKLTGTIESFGAATGAKFSLLPPDNATGNYVKVTQRIPIRIKMDPINNDAITLAPGLSAIVDVEIK